MSLGKREEELIALGISVSAGCKPCTDYHLAAARETGAAEQEIRHAIQLGAAIGRRSAKLMEDYALRRKTRGGFPDAPSARLELLIAIGASYAVNSTDELEHYLAAAGKAKLTETDVKSVAKLAHFIRGRAISHVEDLIDPNRKEDRQPHPSPPSKAMGQGGCGCLGLERRPSVSETANE